jgi:hypothetical protein
MGVSDLDPDAHGGRPWNAGNMVGAKRPLKPRDVWAIRFFLDEHRRLSDRALFDLAIDSKLRGYDIVKMKIGDIVAGGAIRNRATVKAGQYASAAPSAGLRAMDLAVARSLSHIRTGSRAPSAFPRLFAAEPAISTSTSPA